MTAVIAFGVASWQVNAAPTPGASPGAEQPRVSDPDPGPEPTAGTGNDALTSAEVEKAREIAVTPELKEKAKDASGAAGPEFLSADIVDTDGGRRAEVYLYDYATNNLIKQVVDLGGSKLTDSYSAAGLHLPASAHEVDTALDLLLADPLASEFKDAYAKATGSQFAGKDGLKTTAHVFKAQAADPAVAQCGEHRCLRLIVEAKGRYLDLGHLIIDLSGRTVARLS
ncbi:hypothetical protein [Pseudosporangium ferrugineum]|uniref:hypothetical protein n=1 Tax=Pseudosporangium ferrugineum TaxID=439699 RepID=UPI001FE75CD8|nr:hypothetical protein [Pseudosporangium ferrugineum]